MAECKRTVAAPSFKGCSPRSCAHKRELGQRRDADVGFRANTGRKSAHSGTSASSQTETFAASQTKPQLGAPMPVVEALYQINPGTFAVACCETRIYCLYKPSSDKQPI